MNSTRDSIWGAFGFSVALSVITLVGNVSGAFFTGVRDTGMTAFIAFLPMAFLFVAYSQRAARERIVALEARIRELEAR
ncbi:MAG TPA: hypothetical protein VHB77_13345 [Planctomycetaceae bacterium]|nr:hypothetical protein [Planctomycetaceae bacterium]